MLNSGFRAVSIRFYGIFGYIPYHTSWEPCHYPYHDPELLRPCRPLLGPLPLPLPFPIPLPLPLPSTSTSIRASEPDSLS